MLIDPKLAQSEDQGPGIRSGLRDMAASFRAMLEARKMQRHARDEREQRIADEAYRQRQQELALIQQLFAGQRQKLDTEETEQRLNIEKEEHEWRQQEHERLQGILDVETGWYEEIDKIRVKRRELERQLQGITPQTGEGEQADMPPLTDEEKEDIQKEISELRKIEHGIMQDIDVSRGRRGQSGVFGVPIQEYQVKQKEKREVEAEEKAHQRDIELIHERETAKATAEEKARKRELDEDIALLDTLKAKGRLTQGQYDLAVAQAKSGGRINFQAFEDKPPNDQGLALQRTLQKYEDQDANKKALVSIATLIPNKDYAQRVVWGADLFLKGRSFDELDEDSKKYMGKYWTRAIVQNIPGGEIVKRHHQAMSLLKMRIPGLLQDLHNLKEAGKNIGRITQFAEGAARWTGGTSDPDVTAVRTELIDTLNAFIAMRSGAQVTEVERKMYAAIFGSIGRSYEANKAVFEGLVTNIQREKAQTYTEILGDTWGIFVTEVDFAQNHPAMYARWQFDANAAYAASQYKNPFAGVDVTAPPTPVEASTDAEDPAPEGLSDRGLNDTLTPEDIEWLQREEERRMKEQGFRKRNE